MGYFKTLAIDPRAAANYHQRWDGLRAAAVPAMESDPNGSVAPACDRPITREAVGKALRTWRARIQHSPRDLNALNRAALNIEATVWYWHDDTLIITSATSRRTSYRVTATSCQCRAAASGFICWHRWAWTVLDSARRPVASQQPVGRATEDAQAAVDALF